MTLAMLAMTLAMVGDNLPNRVLRVIGRVFPGAREGGSLVGRD
jgi:hypothetical protein